MFRTRNLFSAGRLVAAAVSALVAVSPVLATVTAAQAGERRSDTVFVAASHASKGGRHLRHRHHAGHHFPRKNYFRNGYRHVFHDGALVISLGSGADDRELATGNGDSVRSLLDSNCKTGEYCTIRLGPGPSAPKIITLNRTGSTLDGDSVN